MTKQRRKGAKIDREAVNQVESAIIDMGHIWREQVIEDVGIDGSIELAIDDFPTGKFIGVQIKAGTSYIKCENNEQFTFYPRVDDLEYWKKVIIPVILVVYDPRNKKCYWHDITNYIEAKGGDLFESPKFIMLKKSILDEDFNQYMLSLFDLRILDEEELEEALNALENVNWKSPEYGISVSGLDLFIGGLWGLCTKLQFHLSLLTDTFKQKLATKKTPTAIRMKLDRTSIQPLVIGYLKVLKQYRLADFDANDANYTLYQKMEWPTFIAMLTPSGRKFVEFLRSRLANQRSVCDQQFFNLEYIPHVFIDIIEWFDADNEAFGPVVRSLLVQFNRYLNDYVLLDFKLENEKIKIRNFQHIGFEELRYYIQKELGEIDKNHFIVRHQDELISPLCCWLEEFIDCSVPIPIEQIEMKAPSHHRSLAIELINTMSPGSIAFDVVVEQGDDILQMWAAGATTR